MSSATDDDLVSTARDRVGDGVGFVIHFTERDWEFLYGEAAYYETVADMETRSPEKMHEDAVSRLQQTDVESDLYDNDIRGEVRVTELGTLVHLYPNGREGYFLYLAPDVEVTVPAFLEDCLACVDGTG